MRIHPQAAREARWARRWYAERNPDAGARFLQDYERAIQAIDEFPERWPLFLHDTHRRHLQRFPYSVIYRIGPAAAVLIVAVAHQRRRPDYWLDRL